MKPIDHNQGGACGIRGTVFRGVASNLASHSLRATLALYPAIGIFILSLVFAPLTALAFDKDFPPYPKGKFPPHCKINRLKPVTETDRHKGNFKSRYLLTDKNTRLVFDLNMNYQKGKAGMYLSVKDTAGKVYIKPLKVGWHPTNIDSVYWAYLNKDDKKDFIVNMDVGDGYLSAGRENTTFVLSTKKGYTARQIGTYHLQPEDFYDYSTDNKCEYLHQSLLNTGKKTYWAYNILQFIDGKIVVKNQLSRYFPKWIALSLDPSDKPAKLSTQEKNKLKALYSKQLNISN